MVKVPFRDTSSEKVKHFICVWLPLARKIQMEWPLSEGKRCSKFTDQSHEIVAYHSVPDVPFQKSGNGTIQANCKDIYRIPFLWRLSAISKKIFWKISIWLQTEISESFWQMLSNPYVCWASSPSHRPHLHVEIPSCPPPQNFIYFCFWNLQLMKYWISLPFV